MTHLDILIRLLARSHDVDCPLYRMSEVYSTTYLDECSCKVRPEIERLRAGLVPWAEEVKA